jgi:hypothetical protein
LLVTADEPGPKFARRQLAPYLWGSHRRERMVDGLVPSAARSRSKRSAPMRERRATPRVGVRCWRGTASVSPSRNSWWKLPERLVRAFGGEGLIFRRPSHLIGLEPASAIPDAPESDSYAGPDARRQRLRDLMIGTRTFTVAVRKSSAAHVLGVNWQIPLATAASEGLAPQSDPRLAVKRNGHPRSCSATSTTAAAVY